ncbi:MAG: hypothetical protein ACOYOB_21465, partial [Myxococcota bacterium]
SYLMLDNDGIALGVWTGVKNDWSYGPVRLALEAWIDSNVDISLMPPHFRGDATFQAAIALSAFGVGLGLSAHADLAVDVYDPFQIHGSMQVAAKLPWPLGKWKKSLAVKWTKPKAAAQAGAQAVAVSGDWPPLAQPLKEVAVGHRKTHATWPLPRTAVSGETPLLVPQLGDPDGYLLTDLPDDAALLDQGPAADWPVVPLDSRIELSFARPVGDPSQIGAALGGVVGTVSERIGDPNGQGPVEVSYSVQSAALEAWDGGAWAPVAVTSTPALPGAWAPVESSAKGADGKSKSTPSQTRLWLFADSPLEAVEGVLEGKAATGQGSGGDGATDPDDPLAFLTSPTYPTWQRATGDDQADGAKPGMGAASAWPFHDLFTQVQLPNRPRRVARTPAGRMVATLPGPFGGAQAQPGLVWFAPASPLSDAPISEWSDPATGLKITWNGHDGQPIHLTTPAPGGATTKDAVLGKLLPPGRSALCFPRVGVTEPWHVVVTLPPGPNAGVKLLPAGGSSGRRGCVRWTSRR